MLNDGFEQAPIGQGPFKMKGNWQHDQKIEVERYDDVHGHEAARSTAIDFKIYQRPATATYDDLLAGNLDVHADDPDREPQPRAPADLGDRYQQSPASTFQFLAFPTYDKDFSNPDVRKAISMAIDRDEITDQIFQGSQTPARSFVSPVVPGYRANTCGEAASTTRPRPRSCYAGRRRPGDSSQISYNARRRPQGLGRRHLQPAQDATWAWTASAAPEPKFADLLTKVEARRRRWACSGWAGSMDYPSMENYLGPLYSTNGSSNYYGYSNPEFDSLVDEGRRRPTRPKPRSRSTSRPRTSSPRTCR